MCRAAPLTHVMAMPRRRELLLAHLFAAPLVRENAAGAEENEAAGNVPIKQRNYSRERDVITRYNCMQGQDDLELLAPPRDMRHPW